MAAGTELYLGFARAEMDDVLAQMGLTIDWESNDLFPEDRLKEINKSLKQAWHECVESLGIAFAGNCRPWQLSFHFDPNEYEEDEDQAILGIGLISRYAATFLDYKESHGGSGGMICLNDETMKMIEAARKSIATVLPQWEIAHICFKMVHY